jgi:DNA polymerase III subunit gamma/tau
LRGFSLNKSEGSYKILIIDECHALSSQSWQALLKIVEEPPSDVLFIFATTEVEKVPSTIISRCQRFDFRKIPLTEVKNHLSYVAMKENISIGAAGVNAMSLATIFDGIAFIKQGGFAR